MDLRSSDYLPLLRSEPRFWDLYTRREEYGTAAHVRSQYYDGALNSRPLVSRFLAGEGYSVEYPDGRPFALCLTHDIDDVTMPLSHVGGMVVEGIRSGGLSGLRDLVSTGMRRGIQNLYRNFSEIRAIEERYHASSTFFFLATDQDIVRFRYRVEDLTSDLGTLSDAGGEIGLHGGFSACASPMEIRTQKERLEKVLGRTVAGYRNHFLRFRVPESWEYLEDAGFSYDSTLGYNHDVGFRNGMAHPFRPFDLRTGTTRGILEIPLVVMERAFMNRGIPAPRAWETIRTLLDAVEECRGVLTLNWHNTSFCGPAGRIWGKLYGRILNYGEERRAWMTGAGEVARFWRREGVA